MNPLAELSDFERQCIIEASQLLNGQLRAVQMPDGTIDYVPGDGSWNDIGAGHQFLMAFRGREEPIFQSLVAEADKSCQRLYDARMAEDKAFRDSTFLTYEAAYQQGDPVARDMLIEHVKNWGAVSPVARTMNALPADERRFRAELIRRTAEHNGLTERQQLEVLNEMARNGSSLELAPTRQLEAQSAKDLERLGFERLKGMTAAETLSFLLGSQAEGNLVGAREKPFDPRLSQQQKNEEFLKIIPRGTVRQWMAENPGQDPRAFLDQTLNAARTSRIHTELQGRLAVRDVKLPPLPKPVFNESLDRKNDVRAAFAAHGVEDPREPAGLGQRRIPISGDRLSHVASFAEHTGETVKDIERQYDITQAKEDWEGIYVPGREDEDDSEDNRRADLERAYQQHGG